MVRGRATTAPRTPPDVVVLQIVATWLLFLIERELHGARLAVAWRLVLAA